MKKEYAVLQKVIHWLAQTMQLQLFLTVVSLPVLIAWGLPVSYMSIISTPLFSPIFTLFLLFSSLIFFSQALCIPNAYLIYVLEKITALWLWAIEKHNGAWLIGFIKPPIFILIMPIIAVVMMLHIKQINSAPKRIGVLIIIIVIFCSGLKYYAYCMPTLKTTIACHQGALTLLYDNNKTILIDPGFLGSKPANNAWISYSLMPEITKVTGTFAIDTLILLQLNQRTLETLLLLMHKVPIKRIYLPRYQGRLHKKTWSILMQCQKKYHEQKGVWLNVFMQPLRVYISRGTHLTVSPTQKTIQYQDASYALLQVEGSIDNNPFAIYAAKKEKKG